MPLMALKKICGSCFKHGCSTISWGMLLELRNCSWNFGVVLTIAGLLKSTGLLYKKRKNRNQYIYTSGSWSFNLSNSELAEAWFVQSIQWPLRLRRTSIWVIMSTHQNSLHDQSTQLKEWWLGLEPMIYWHSRAEKKIWRTGERESGLSHGSGKDVNLGCQCFRGSLRYVFICIYSHLAFNATTTSCCISIDWWVGRGDCHTVRCSSKISDTVRIFFPQVIFDCKMLTTACAWTCLTMPCKATILEPRAETSLLFSHGGHLLSGTAQNHTAYTVHKTTKIKTRLNKRSPWKM